MGFVIIRQVPRHLQLSNKRYSESIASLCPSLNPQTSPLGPGILGFHSIECRKRVLGGEKQNGSFYWWSRFGRGIGKRTLFSWKADNYPRKYHSVKRKIIAKQDVSLEAYKQPQQTVPNSSVWDFGVQFLLDLTKRAVICLEWDFIELY